MQARHKVCDAYIISLEEPMRNRYERTYFKMETPGMAAVEGFYDAV
jgi:hypothetical protein